MIFDEIDAGISGKTAWKVAEKMGVLARNHQIICITHLPQIAARGTYHYKVYKEETATGTVTEMIKLEQQERVREIAQMMSGEMLTDVAMENALHLLSQS